MFAEKWDEECEGEPAPTERIWYIESLDGKLHRWTNADFIRVVLPDICGIDDPTVSRALAEWAALAQQRHGLD